MTTRTFTLRRVMAGRYWRAYEGKKLVPLTNPIYYPDPLRLAERLKREFPRCDVLMSDKVRKRPAPVPFCKADAGSPADRRNDCTVRALTLVSGRPYAEAEALLARRGRRHNLGFNLSFDLGFDPRHYEGLGVKFERLPWRARRVDHWDWSRGETRGSGCQNYTVSSFLKAHPTGTFLCFVREHVFAVYDGMVFDSFQPPPRQRVLSAFRVTDCPAS